MIQYKKTETKLKHDKVRQEHIKEMQEIYEEWVMTHDYSILAKLIRYEDQLRYYDRIMGYDKIGTDYWRYCPH